MYVRFDKHAMYKVFPVSPGKLGECIEAPKMKQEVRVNTRSQSLTSTSVDTVIFPHARNSVYTPFELNATHEKIHRIACIKFVRNYSSNGDARTARSFREFRGSRSKSLLAICFTN